MLFNSFIFLYAFLPVTWFVFQRLRTKTHRYIWLTIASYFFYGWWNWKFCFLMAFSTLVSYTAGLGLLRFDSGPRRRLCMTLPIVVDLSILGFFKYANFFMRSTETMLAHFGAHASWTELHILLPIGISFYTLDRKSVV